MVVTSDGSYLIIQGNEYPQDVIQEMQVGVTGTEDGATFYLAYYKEGALTPLLGSNDGVNRLYTISYRMGQDIYFVVKGATTRTKYEVNVSSVFVLTGQVLKRKALEVFGKVPETDPYVISVDIGDIVIHPQDAIYVGKRKYPLFPCDGSFVDGTEFPELYKALGGKKGDFLAEVTRGEFLVYNTSRDTSDLVGTGVYQPNDTMYRRGTPSLVDFGGLRVAEFTHVGGGSDIDDGYESNVYGRTVEGWFYIKSDDYPDEDIAIMGHTHDTMYDQGFTYAFCREILTRNGQIIMRQRLRQSGTRQDYPTGITMPIGEWVHLCLEATTSESRLYVNGQQVLSVSWDGDFTFFSTVYFTVGKAYGQFTGYSFDGYFGGGRVFAGNVYNGNFTPPSMPMKGVGTPASDPMFASARFLFQFEKFSPTDSRNTLDSLRGVIHLNLGTNQANLSAGKFGKGFRQKSSYSSNLDGGTGGDDSCGFTNDSEWCLEFEVYLAKNAIDSGMLLGEATNPYYTPSQTGWWLEVMSDGRMVMRTDANRGTMLDVPLEAFNYDDEWHHIAFNHSPENGIWCHIDGQQVAHNPTPDPIILSTKFALGTGSSQGNPSRYWLDELRVTNALRYALGSTFERIKEPHPSKEGVITIPNIPDLVGSPWPYKIVGDYDE